MMPRKTWISVMADIGLRNVTEDEVESYCFTVEKACCEHCAFLMKTVVYQNVVRRICAKHAFDSLMPEEDRYTLTQEQKLEYFFFPEDKRFRLV